MGAVRTAHVLHIPRYRKYRASADIYVDVARIFPAALHRRSPVGEAIGVATAMSLVQKFQGIKATGGGVEKEKKKSRKNTRDTRERKRATRRSAERGKERRE